MAQVNIRIDDDLKSRADNLFEELGMNMTTAFNIFLRQAVRQGGIPFPITTAQHKNIGDITLASEHALAKDWLLPEEDKAWENL